MIQDPDPKLLDEVFKKTMDPNFLYEEADDDDDGGPGAHHHHHPE
jgi:hypothetical protein